MKTPSLPTNMTRFLERADSVIDNLRGHKGKIRVISHYDGDGICAAALATKALMENDIPFQTSMIRSLDKAFVRRLVAEQNKFILFLDLGSGQIELLEQLDCTMVVCDHHRPRRESKKIIQLNPHFFDIDGTYEACGSTLGFLIAEKMVERPETMFGVALAGMLADRQHLGGFTGINKMLLDKYVEKEAVKVEPSLQLEGKDIQEAIKNSLEPFFKELSGRGDAVRNLLSKIGIDPKKRLEELHQEQFMALSSMLVLWLLRQGVRPETCEDFVIERYWLEPFKLYGRQLAAVVNACGRRGEEDTGLAICLGSKEALERGHALREEHRSAIRKDLLSLEKEGAKRKKHIQFFYSEDPARAGALAGLGMNYLLDQTRPTLTLSRVKDDVKVSSRGTKWLISKGLDLAEACRVAAEKVKGAGGGHPIAAGATVPLKAEGRFLSTVDKMVGEQVKLEN
jgi:RecJ-like exonuclease